MDSKPIQSNQKFASRRIERILNRYSLDFRKPIPMHATAALEQISDLLHSKGYSKCVLDAGCGTGESTDHLGLIHEDALVIGLDKSEHRLKKSHLPSKQRPNTILIRTELHAFFWLCIQQQFTFQKIYFLYPNPWPKRDQIKRRVHVHPMAPLWARLSSAIECRTNWPTFAIEFSRTMRHFGFQSVNIDRNFLPRTTVSPFERKYVSSKHKLVRVKGFRMPTQVGPHPSREIL